MEQFRKIEKLPLFASPTEYALRLTPDFDGGSFNGVLDVAVDILKPSRFLVLNSVDLGVDEDSISFKSPEGEIEFLKGQLFEDEQIIVLEFREFLPVGSGVLRLGFVGVLKQETGGFWCSSGEKSARRCFPCWDEPDFKATFKITLEVPTELVALSNMPVLEEEKVNGNLKIVSYHASPIMSTSLVAIVVGSFDYEEDHTSDGIKVRIYSQVGKADQGKFALHVGAKTLDLFKEFFGVPYPVPKLDLIAIPDFAAGATEYYGLATYPETALLYDEQHSAPDASQMNQFLQILGLHSNPQYTKEVMELKPELQRMTLKPEFLRLLNSKEAMQQMNNLQQSLFSGYWNTIRARDQTGATTGAIRNSHSQTFEAHDVVMNKRTGSVGVVSSDKFYVHPVDKLAKERFRNEDFVPVSRPFGHGDSVCSLTEEGRKGLIIGLEMKVALASSTEEVSQLDIGTTRLQRIRRFFEGDFVVCDSWVGVVKGLELGIDIRFEDGGKITNVDPDADSLKPIFINAAEVVNNQPYYRGQAVVDETGWEGVTGRVVRHGDNMLEIDWFYTSEPGKKKPPTRLRHTQVKVLNIPRFSAAGWTVGERCVMEGDDYLIVKVRTQVEVQWQDGRVDNVDSRELVSLEGRKEDFFCGFFVSKKNDRNVGGFVRMVANGGVAWVKWFGDQPNQPEILYEAEITRHPFFKFEIGNLVAQVLSEEEENHGVGFVVALADGLVQVEWEDRKISSVNPSRIHRLTFDEDRHDPDSASSSSSADASSSSGDDDSSASGDD